jgi:alkylation response protein AidB-like acyl-CoA dehydrogenase
MFTMMNAARLSVGVQGLALAERALQNSLNYARERLQSRSLSGPKFPDKPPTTCWCSRTCGACC